MKIALVRSPATYADWYRRPPLGIAYICSFLESKGFECRIFDAYFHGWSQKELFNRVFEYLPNVVGFTAMTHEVIQTSQLAIQIKQHMDVPTIIGGCHVTALPDRTLEEFTAFDYGIYGEGENSFLELLNGFQEGGVDPTSIRSLVYRDGSGKVQVNKAQPYLEAVDLEALPYPAYHQYYATDSSALASKGAYYAIMTSRGCPYKCVFCMQVLGRKVRQRSADNILDEIEFAITNYSAHTIHFIDEIFLFDNAKTRDLLVRMINRGLPKRIKWHGRVRANLVSRELIELAKDAGCCGLEMGVESGDDDILKAINKEITVAQVKNAVKIIKACGITLGTYFILGHPGETKQTMRKTVQLASKLNTNTIAVGLMVPYPGTKVYEMASRGEGGYRLLTQNWSEYDKYYARALEIQGLPYKEMLRAQKRALINLYLKNFRVLDAFKYFWERRRVFLFLFRKMMVRAQNT